MLYIHKDHYQISKTRSLKYFQDREELEWLALATRKENNIIKMLTYQTNLNKTF